jgi:hypothetical protein
MTTWIEPHSLLALVAQSHVRGVEPPHQAVMRSPTELIPVTEASMAPLDVATYEVRLERWRRGEGPRLTGIEDFVARLRSLGRPTRAVTVIGELTTYVYLLDAEMTRAIAGVAIDPPAPGTDSP